MYRNEEISLEYRVNKAFEGRYYIGHTPVMTLHGNNAWGGLMNPQGSGVNLFVNTFTVSNYTDTPFRSQLWVNTPPECGCVSPYVSPTNVAKIPPCEPRAQLVYQAVAQGMPAAGTSLLSRIAPANDTVVGNYYGKIVIPPGAGLIVLLYAPRAEVAAEVALGWWEDRITKPY